MKELLSKEERGNILQMSSYWREVAKREDASPLMDELRTIAGMLGTRILFIIAEYARLENEGGEK